MPRIGFVGAGHIGSNMALRLIDKGYRLCVCDLNDVVRQSFVGKADVTGRCADLAESDVVIMMVADDRQLEAALFGQHGLVEGLTETTSPALIVMSTVIPATVRALPERLSGRRMIVVDAPVSGGPASARKGALSIMAGGSAADFEAVRPVLEDLGEHVFYCGPLGAGAAAKLVNNVLGVCNVYLAAEAYALAQALGTDLAKIIPILEAGTGRNFWSKSLEETVGQYRAFTNPEAGFYSMIDIVTKDLRLIDSIPERADLALPMLRGVAEGVQGLHDRGVAEKVFRQWVAIAAANDR